MEIEIIKFKNKKNQTIVFANILNNFLSCLKILHWYSNDINVHNIIGDLYSSLSENFDKFQEEIIGVSNSNNNLFPIINEENYNFKCGDEILEENVIDCFDKNLFTFLNLLNSVEIDNFIKASKSGLNNTKEEILSSINKSKYLISMVNSNQNHTLY
jgi:hypothetical protein